MNSLLLNQMYFLENLSDHRAESDYRASLEQYFSKGLISTYTYNILKEGIKAAKKENKDEESYQILKLDDFKLHDNILKLTNSLNSRFYVDKGLDGEVMLGVYEADNKNVAIYTADITDLELLRSTLNDILGE